MASILRFVMEMLVVHSEFDPTACEAHFTQTSMAVKDLSSHYKIWPNVWDKQTAGI